MSKCSRGYQSLTYLSPSHFLFSLTTFYPLSAKDVELLTLCCRMQGAGKCCSVLTMFMSHPLCLLRLSGLASDVAQPSAPSLASPAPARSAALHSPVSRSIWSVITRLHIRHQYIAFIGMKAGTITEYLWGLQLDIYRTTQSLSLTYFTCQVFRVNNRC